MKLELDMEAFEAAIAGLAPRLAEEVAARLKEWRPLEEADGGLEIVVTVDDLSRHLRLTRSAIQGRVKKNQLPAPRRIAGSTGWLASELNAWFRGPAPAAAPAGDRSTARGPVALHGPRHTGRSAPGRRRSHD